MTLSKNSLHALDNYVSFCARVYDAAYQSLKLKAYPDAECRYFASLMLIQTVDKGGNYKGTKEDELRSYMAAMTPGGEA